jgi:hypothetical protein
MKYSFVAVSGFGKSGSGACIDILKEFDHIGGLDREFRIAKDPCGLIDLESSLISNWEFVRHNTAINDFIDYCQMLGRNEGLFTKTGKGFSDSLGISFLSETERYINRITDFTYYGDTLLQRYNLTVKELLIQRMRSKFKLDNKKQMYFAKPTKDKFLIETNTYIRNLFNNFANNNNLKVVVLDQAIPPNNISKSIQYFNKSKLIIVDRDPRDIYATMFKEKRLLGADSPHPVSFEKYSVWHKSVRHQSQNDISNSDLDANVLRLNFESFFVDYDITIDRIKEFLGVDFPHRDKGMRFSPDTMQKYVGIWRTLPDQYTISRIKEEFIDSCFLD